MQTRLFLSALVLVSFLQANEQNQDNNEVCGKPAESMLDALNHCAKRFEEAASEFKGYLDSNVFKDENQSTNVSASSR